MIYYSKAYIIFFPNLFSDSMFKLLARVKRKHHICDECGHSFPKPSKLKRHVDGVHLKLKPFKCDKCDLAFFQEGALKNHVEERHEKIRYPCNFCNTSYTKKSKMSAHIKNKHQELLFLWCSTMYTYCHNFLK